MSRKSSFLEDLSDFLEAVGKAIAIACKWTYENIVWALAAMVLIDVFLFIPLAWGFSILNGIIVIFFVIRLLVEHYHNHNGYV